GTRCALRIKRRGGSVVAGNDSSEFLSLFARDESVHHSGSITSNTRFIDHGFFLHLPSISYPDWHRSAPRRWLTAKVKIEPTCLFALTVQELHFLEDVTALGLEQLRPLAADFPRVIQDSVEHLLIGLIPLTPFTGLHPVLVVDLHHCPGGDQF